MGRATTLARSLDAGEDCAALSQAQALQAHIGEVVSGGLEEQAKALEQQFKQQCGGRGDDGDGGPGNSGEGSD